MPDALNIKSRILIFIASLVILQLIASFFILPHTLWVEVFINGRKVKLAANTSLSEILAQQRFNCSAGDLVDVEGKVIAKGGGKKAQVLVNGQPAKPAKVIEGNDSIYYKPGSPIVEGLSQDYDICQTPVKTSGLRSQSSPPDKDRSYMRVVTKGALSGKVIGEAKVDPPLIFGKKTQHIKANAIALCFDDGPDPHYTPQIIDILKEKRAPATFFVIGRFAEKYPDLLKLEAKNGFEIGNHTYNHKKISKISLLEVEQELMRTDTVITNITGRKPVWFRPPQLLYTEASAGVIQSHGYNIVLGSIDPSDYLKPPPESIINIAIEQARTGSIVVMHDGGGDRSNTVAALPALIDRLRAAGYEFVSIEGLFTD